MKPGRWIVLLLSPLLFSACATLPTLPPESPPADELLRRVEVHQQALQGWKGLAQFKISSPEKKLSGQQVVFARRPASLRVESLSPLGSPVLYLVTDGQKIRLYNPGENRYYQGSFQKNSLAFALPIDLSPEEIVAFLLGGVLRTDHEKASIRAEPKEGLWVLDLSSPSRGESQTLWVHPQSFYVVRAQIHRPQQSYQLAFADFHPVQGILFPQRMTLLARELKTQISVEVQEAEVNPPWEAEDFNLPVPQGATVVPLP